MRGGLDLEHTWWQLLSRLLSRFGKNKALFLDRDGTINVDIGYAHKEDQMQYIDGIFELCIKAKEYGYKLVVVTNQSGIARGMYTEVEFMACMDAMADRFKREGCSLDAIYYCPYHIDGNIKSYKRASKMRKPFAGMLFKAAVIGRLDLSKCILVGDQISDMQAAVGAKVKKYFWLSKSADERWDWCRCESLEEVRGRLQRWG